MRLDCRSAFDRLRLRHRLVGHIRWPRALRKTKPEHYFGCRDQRIACTVWAPFVVVQRMAVAVVELATADTVAVLIRIAAVPQVVVEQAAAVAAVAGKPMNWPYCLLRQVFANSLEGRSFASHRPVLNNPVPNNFVPSNSVPGHTQRANTQRARTTLSAGRKSNVCCRERSVSLAAWKGIHTTTAEPMTNKELVLDSEEQNRLRCDPTPATVPGRRNCSIDWQRRFCIERPSHGPT